VSPISGQRDLLGPHSDAVVGAHALLDPKQRRIRKQFLVEGPMGVDTALNAGLVTAIYVGPDAPPRFHQVRGVRTYFVSASAIAKISETHSPQGVVAVCAQPDHVLEEIIHSFTRFVACDGVSDPGNLGSIIRSAAAAGYDALITTNGSADIYNGKVVRATVGTFATMPLVGPIDSQLLVTLLRQHNVNIVTTSSHSSLELYSSEVHSAVDEPHVWVIGSEAHGASAIFMDAADLSVRIPMVDAVESLNAAVAAGLCLFAGNAIRASRAF